jgi:hypothetical protein
VIAKDTVKETLGGQLGVTERASNGVSLIAEANFTRRTQFFSALPPCRIAQVHVSASPATLRARLLDRGADRHPVHYDGEVANEIAARAAAGEWDPLPLPGVLLRIDTTNGFDFDAAALLTKALAQGRVTLF